MKISFVDPIYCKVDPKEDIELIKKCFEYDSVYYKQGAYKKEAKINKAYLCNKPHKGLFLGGLLSKVQSYCELNNITLDIDQNPFIIEKIKRPLLPQIAFREDQTRLLLAINKYQRGQIKSPTGSGKTVLAGGLISQFPRANVIFIVHTQALFTQTVEEFKKWFGNDNVGEIGQGKYEPKQITVFMIQIANQICKKNEETKKFDHPKYKWLCDWLAEQDIIICDESHHCGSTTGGYAAIYERCLAPIRIGFTATPNPNLKEALICEGYLGPVIGELKIEDGIENGILAKPRLKLITVPKIPSISKLDRYYSIYQDGIVLNRVRNRLIAKEANDQIIQNKSVLIMITDVLNKHGEIIQEFIFDIYGHKSELVHGGTKKDIREDIKKALNLKQTKCVIVTSAWREGINIPSLDCVINAIGGKSEIVVLQAIGRGMRTSEGKEEILIVDFLDPYRYLAEHTIMRLNTYNEIGILNLKANG